MVGIVGLCGSFKVAHGPGSVVCVCGLVLRELG